MSNPTDFFLSLLMAAMLYAAIFYLALPRLVLIEDAIPFRWSIYRRLPNSFMVWPALFALGLALIFSPFSTPLARDLVGLLMIATSSVTGWHIGQRLAREEIAPDGRTS